MKPAAFDYERPADLQSALRMLDGDSEARILAGGQSLVPMMNVRLARPARLIDINRLPGLDHIRAEDGEIVIGALARHNAVMRSDLIGAHFPMMVEAYDYIAHAAVRNRGTLCGNLCHADPASELPAIMLVLGAKMMLQSAGGTRDVAAEAFFTGLYETAVKPDEMLTEVRIPVPDSGLGWGFEEVAMRKGDYAWASVVVTLRLSDGTIADPRIAVAGVGDRAARLADAESALAGQRPDADLLNRIAEDAAGAIDPPGSEGVSAAYRRDLLHILLPRVIEKAAERAA